MMALRSENYLLSMQSKAIAPITFLGEKVTWLETLQSISTEFRSGVDLQLLVPACPFMKSKLTMKLPVSSPKITIEKQNMYASKHSKSK